MLTPQLNYSNGRAMHLHNKSAKRLVSMCEMRMVSATNKYNMVRDIEIYFRRRCVTQAIIIIPTLVEHSRPKPS